MSPEPLKPLRWYEVLLALGVAALGVWLCLGPALASSFQVVVGDSGDARLIQLVLETGYEAALGRSSVFDPPFFSPAPHVGGFTDNLLGLQPLYLPLRLFTSAHNAYQAMLVLSALLNFWLFFVLVRVALRVDGVPALVGAALFTFGTPRLAQLNHPQLFFQGWALIALLGAAQVMRGRHAAWVLALVGGAVGQLYASWYHGWFLCFGLGLALVWSVALPTLRGTVRTHLKRTWRWLAVAVVVGGVALLPFVRTALLAARLAGWRSFDEVAGMLPRATSWFFTSPHSYIYGKLFANVSLPMSHEHVMGVGLVTTGFIVAALISGRRRPVVAVLGLVLLTLVVLTVNSHGVSPCWFIFKLVPGARAVRAVTRVSMSLLVLYGLALATLAQRLRARWQWVMLAVVCAEQGVATTGYDAAPVIARQQALAAAVPAGCQTFFAYARAGEPFDLHLDAMWAALWLQKKTINGYSGAEPYGWHLFEAVVSSEAQLTDLKRRLADWETLMKLPPESVCLVEAPR